MAVDAPIAAALRGALLAFLTGVTAVLATLVFARIIGNDGFDAVDLPLLTLYAVLTTWLALGFWQAAIGSVVLVGRMARRRPAGATARFAAPANTGTDPLLPPRTAILFPVYNEDPSRVFAAIRTMLESLDVTGLGHTFDFFVLSDTRHPDTWLLEEAEWAQLRAKEGLGPRLFYRRRPQNTARKSGNIADFLERWGGNYAYMIVLDADSVMRGAAMAELVRRMDANPRAALIQIPPKPVYGETLFARLQCFAASVYGPLGAAGLAWVMRENGNFWGHNAIIRVEPFINHCDLPHLPGRAPLGGEILSHDFVEAALLRRAGWEVWIADDLEGSYEESPPAIIDFAKRDRRWCQGNLQHFRLIFATGLHPSSRFYFATGVMAYVSSLLWLMFLLLGATEVISRLWTEPVYFQGGVPFPQWPVSVHDEAVDLFIVTMAALFLPKVMGWLLLMADGPRRRAQGGALRATLSVVLEALYAALLAPIMMLFHSNFVLSILFGIAVGWGPQRRGGTGANWTEAARDHAGHTGVGLVAGAAILAVEPGVFWWALPILLGLVLSIPLSVLSSSAAVGLGARRLGLFLTEEEGAPAGVLTRLQEYLAAIDRRPPEPLPVRSPFARVVTDPTLNAIHAGLLRAYGGEQGADPAKVRAAEAKVIDQGLETLSGEEKLAVLQDADAIERLHMAIWTRWATQGDAAAAPAG